MRITSRGRLCALAVLLITIATAILLYFQQPAPPAWVTTRVRSGDIASTIVATGKLDAAERVNVGAQVSGQLRRLTVSVGDRVTRGQLLAEIDDLPQRNELRNAEAALSVAREEQRSKQALLQREQAELRRQQQMLRDDASSQKAYQAAVEAQASARAGLAAQQARIIQAQIEVDKKRLDLSYTRIMAPMDGTVIAVVTRQGQTVNASLNAPVIVKLARLEQMTIRVQISEADINSVRPGQQAWFTTFAEPDKRYNATLRSIELAPESVMKDDTQNPSQPAGQNTAVYYNGLLDVPNPDNTLRIAMTAQVSLQRAAAKHTLLIPLQAVNRTAEGKAFVSVPGKNTLPQQRLITTGITDNVDIQVVHGLDVGDEIILSSASDAGNGVLQ